MQARTEAASSASVRLNLVVSPQLNQTLEELAELSHSTKSEILRKAIALYEVVARAKKDNQKIGILDQEEKIVKEIVGI